ncbi:hypothetical protein JWJ90_21505 [Desulfobulbus rhabdoformis]|uniref:hypothetical protein n=1 Tax=Desulfobulbus rhabdoformis TaxID=34032 RepID=UPI001965C18D|nr:hypothetical protein [Desulfobulbus rhabdoformis]MBM9616844.1 hypothetical protein [Desulfobulbus rhabdoformis]
MFKITVSLLTFFTFSVAHSTPSILSFSSSPVAENQIIISGADFGSTGPNVVLFDDFSEDIEEGAQFSATAKIGTWQQMHAVKYSDAALSNGQGARLILEDGHIQNYFLFPEPASEVFVSSYAYVPSGYKFPTATEFETMPDVSALKHHWVYYGPNGYASGAGHDVFGPNWTGTSWMTVTSNETKVYLYQEWKNPGWEWGKPVRLSHWLKGNEANVEGTEGAFQGVTSTGQVNSVYNESNMDGKVWFNPEYEDKGMPYVWDRLSVVGYFRSGSSYPTHNYVIDDVYLAIGPNAAARVEIGNAPVYENCTKLAIATPDTWTDTSINVTVRGGRFSSDDSVYLFVIDASNTPSKGYGPLSFQNTDSMLLQTQPTIINILQQ